MFNVTTTGTPRACKRAIIAASSVDTAAAGILTFASPYRIAPVCGDRRLCAVTERTKQATAPFSEASRAPLERKRTVVP